ncbi:carbohydrate ABC transporter permease [Lachnotalea sp. AF33-28]|uniref:carbohydrate ABC transporter permease n=1 Tax=Lachnotalea sp. AF33-28 TaxID=2292046 RepID=UPI000E540D27|nr:carbohydrate ABC transporter permease [Lachnotalea sp. AF33-28]RHP30096.1 carbohydrate ABC transporter permease [Lachnotalea sp. AF33-28]
MSTKTAVMKKKKWTEDRTIKLILRLLLLCFSVIYIYPVIFAVITSLKTLPEFYTDIWALPKNFLYGNYIEAFFTGKIGEYFLNSVIIAVCSILAIQVISTMAAYALTRLRVPHTNLILLILFALQILPTETIIIPLYVEMSKIGFLRMQYVPIIIAYVGWSIPGSAIILKNFFETVPKELLEAARIDGSGEVKSLFLIVLPLMKSAVCTVSIMNFNFVWGELMWAQIATLLTDKGLPLTVGLLNFKGQISTNWPQLCAAICIVILPLYLIFLLMQKYFIAGLTAGGVKG